MTPDSDALESLRTENAQLRRRAAAAEEEISQLRALQAQGSEPGEPAAQAVVGRLAHPVLDRVIAQRLTDAELQNAALRLRLLGPPPPPAGISVQQLVESIALSASLGEATLADRALGTLSISAQMMVVEVDQGAVSVQLPSPATPLPSDTLSTVTVAFDRNPPAPGQPDPPTLYRVLAQKQALYGHDGWFATDPGKAIVAACTAALAEAAGWTFAAVLATADAISASEQSLATALSAREPAPAGTSGYESAAAASREQIDGLMARSSAPVAGDLAALGSALYNVTVAAAGVAL